jgi:hypothetical protein
MPATIIGVAASKAWNEVDMNTSRNEWLNKY